MTNKANEAKKAVKVTTLAKALIINAQFTDKTHFIGKSIGEDVFANWQKALKALKEAGFLYYEALATDADNIAEAEKQVYTEIKNLLALVGEIPCKEDNTIASKINSKVLFFDAVALATKQEAKVEVEKLTKAREALRQAKTDYRKNCLTVDGIAKAGLTEDYVKSHTDKINEAQKTVEKLLQVKGNSVFGTEEAKLSTFAKKFEIQLRKAMLVQYNWTAKQVKQDKEAKKQERKQNRNK